MTGTPSAQSSRLSEVLETCAEAAIAVSGGVDSMTLAAYAHRLLGAEGIRMVHAVSPAVPAAATERVRAMAANAGWRLDLVDAGEFADARYRANPLDRCFFCKSNLYATLGRMSAGVVLSGTNRDDLGDFRPGLRAAADHGVRHPYVEAGLAKADVRALARTLGLTDLAQLPASPCLASRVETGLRIEARDLRLIDEVESWLRAALGPREVRCRVRHSGLAIELDADTLDSLTLGRRADLAGAVRARWPATAGRGIAIEPYRRGSAFVGSRAAAS